MIFLLYREWFLSNIVPFQKTRSILCQPIVKTVELVFMSTFSYIRKFLLNYIVKDQQRRAWPSQTHLRMQRRNVKEKYSENFEEREKGSGGKTVVKCLLAPPFRLLETV